MNATRTLITLICAAIALSTPLRAEVTAGPFTRIYNPSQGQSEAWYINDHCFVHADDGRWHLFGITHPEPAAPLDEDNLAHATADTLTQAQWTRQPFALSVDPAFAEEHLWAPYVIRHEGLYYMYYCAGDKDHTRYKIHLATSTDLKSWKRSSENPMIVDGYDARDPFVLRMSDHWLMYYTATDDPKGGHHVVATATSKDLIHWTSRRIVFLDPSQGTYGGPTESPFVVRRGPWYYLFIGPRGGYVGTDVYRSKDPLYFNPTDKAGHIEAHAAEVVRDTDGKWYVSRCGWGKGGVYLAPLNFNDNLDNAETSQQPGH